MSATLTCRACGGIAKFQQAGALIGRAISYFECDACGYYQTENPYWLSEAYASAINDSDTGIMMRNQTNSRIVLGAMWLTKSLDSVVVDYAGGYGILVRMLRDFGVNAKWADQFCQNLVAKGFEFKGEKAALVTAFEAFEHFENPAEELDNLLKIAPNVLLSTELIATPAPKQSDWWYYGSEHGQHIGFFRKATLEKLALDRGLFLITNGSNLHLLTHKPMNTLLWRLMIKFNRLIPFFLQGRIKSRTLEDHKLIADHSI